MNVQITEIFYSFQGESSFAGHPTVFIRFFGCNLRCRICDTKYSYRHGYRFDVEKLIRTILKFDCRYVCITGGEPLLQRQALIKIIRELKKHNRIISVETNGACSIKGLPLYVKKVVDVKTPSTGCEKSFLKSNLKYITGVDELKFVISDIKDYKFSKKFLSDNSLYRIGCRILFSPNLEKTNFAEKLVTLILKDKLDVVFAPQLHKLIKERPVILG